MNEKVYRPFLDKFKVASEAMKFGNGLDETVSMGPLAHERRVHAVGELIADAVRSGAKVVTGGKRLNNSGYFFNRLCPPTSQLSRGP